MTKQRGHYKEKKDNELRLKKIINDERQRPSRSCECKCGRNKHCKCK